MMHTNPSTTSSTHTQHPQPTKHLNPKIPTFLAIAITAASTTTHATIYTWTGNHPSSPNWNANTAASTFNNWAPLTPLPGASDTVLFGNNFGSTFSSGNPTLNGDREVGEFWINHTGSRIMITNSSDTLTLADGIIIRTNTSTDNQEIRSDISLGDTGNWDIRGTGSLIIDARIKGAQPLNKSGNGTLVLQGTTNNTYTGLTTVSDGALHLNKTPGINALRADLTITGSAEVKLLAHEQINNTATVNVNGGFFRTAGKNETIDTLNFQSGEVHFDDGNLTTTTIDDTGLGTYFLGTGSSTSTFIIHTGTLNSDINGDGVLVKNGDGVLDFNANVSGDLDLLINQGQVDISPTLATTFASPINIDSSGILNLITNSSTPTTLDLTGNGTLRKSGAAQLSFQGTVDPDINLIIQNGIFKTSTTTANTFNSPITINDLGTLNLDDITNTTLTRVLTGTGQLLKTGTAITTIGTGGIADNTNTGLTTVSNGELRLNKANGTDAIGGDLQINPFGDVRLLQNNQIPNTATVNVNGGFFRTAGKNETIDTLNFQSGEVHFGGGNLTTTTIDDTGLGTYFLGTGSSTNTFTIRTGTLNSDINGDGVLVKNGAGALDFNANVSGDLDLQINQGRVDISPTLATAFTSPINIDSSGILNLITNSNTSETLDLTGSGTLRKSGAAQLNFQGTIDPTINLTVQNGSFTTNTVTANTFNNPITINEPGAFEVNDTTSSTLTQNFVGNGTLIKSGTTTLTYTGSSDENINLQIDNGTFKIPTSTANDFNAPITINDLGTLHLDDTTDATLTQELTGTGQLLITNTAITTIGTADSTHNTNTGLTNVGNFELILRDALSTDDTSSTELRLNKAPGTNAIGGDLLVRPLGDVRLLADNQIPDTATVTVNRGIFRIAGKNETIHTLDFRRAGEVRFGDGNFTTTTITDDGAGSYNLGITSDTNTFTVDNGSINNDINGDGVLVKNGTGVLDFNASFFGNLDLQINQGRVDTSPTLAAGFASPININSPGELNLITVSNTSETIDLTGNGTLRKSGAAQLSFQGTVDPDINLIIQNGIFKTSTTTANTFNSPITINDLGTLNLDDITNTTLTRVLTGTGQLLKTGTAITTIGTGGIANNTNTGLTTVDSGELRLNKADGTDAIGGNLQINPSGDVRLLQNNQIPNTATVNVNGGIFRIAGKDEAIDTLDFQSGEVLFGDGNLTTNTVTDDGTGSYNLGITSDTNTFTVTTGNIDSDINGDGVLVKNGAGALDFNANVSGDLDLQINQGRVDISPTLATAFTSPINIDSSGILNLITNSSTPTTLDLTGSGTLRKSGAAQLSFQGTVDPDINLIIQNGTFKTSTTTANTFNSPITINDIGTLNLDDTTDATLTQELTGEGTLIKSGTATLTYTGSFDENINLQIDNGTFKIPTSTANDFNTPITINDPGTLHLDDTADATLTQELTGTGQLHITNTAITTIGDADSTDNTNTGLTTVDSGELRLNKADGTDAIGGNLQINPSGDVRLLQNNQIPNTATVNVNGGIFRVAGKDEAIDTLNFQSGEVHFGGGNLTTNTIIDNGAGSYFLGATLTNTFTAHDGTIASDINGDGVLVKNGAGTLNFNATIIDTLNLQIQQGTLNTTHALAGTFNAPININPAGKLQITTDTDTTFSLDLAGNGTLVKAGPATMTYNGTVPATIKLQVDEGTFLTTTPDANDFNNPITINTDGTLQLDDNTDATLTRTLTGTGHLLKTGTATTTITTDGGFNTHTGLTTIDAGRLHLHNLEHDDAIAGDININAAVLQLINPNQISDTANVTVGPALGTFDLNGNDETINTLQINAPASTTLNNANLTLVTLSGNGNIDLGFAVRNTVTIEQGTFSGLFAGTATLAKAGTGTFTFNGSAFPDVDLRIDDGTFSTTTPKANGFNTTITINTDGTLQLDDTTDNTLSQTLTGAGQLLKTNTATTTLGGFDPNTNTGLTTIDNGELRFNKSPGTDAIGGNLTINTSAQATLLNDNQIPDTANVTVNAGLFDLNGFNETINTLHMSAPGTTNLNGGTLTTNDITGDGTIIGSGTIAGDITIEPDGTLAGDTNVIGEVQIAGTTAPGSSPGIINVTGSYTATPTATLQIEVLNATLPAPGTDFDQVNITGPVTLDGTLEIIPLTDPTTFATTPLGTTFDILSYTTRTGYFANITGTLINTSFALAPLINDTDDTLQLRATIPGDLNLDNKVSVADLSTFALNFGTTPGLYDEADTTNSWQLGDFNTDGQITVADLSLLALNFGFELLPDGSTTPATPLSIHTLANIAGIDPTTIPEPTTGLLAIAMAFMVHQHRSRATNSNKHPASEQTL